MMDEKQAEVIAQLQKDLESEKKMRRKMTVLAVVFTALTILCFLIDNFALAILVALPAVVIWYLIYLCRGSVERIERDLYIAQSDMEKYERMMRNRTIDAQAQIRQNQKIQEVQHPQCPMCGSQNTQRITTISRTASVAAVGLASSKIGKQFECKNCKYKW